MMSEPPGLSSNKGEGGGHSGAIGQGMATTQSLGAGLSVEKDE